MLDTPILVKDALREGDRLKNYRFNVLNDDGSVDFTIDNDTLVYESVKIDERMCSGDTLKFGLCEGSSLEFQYFDHPNIRKRRIQAFIDVQYYDKDGIYETQYEYGEPPYIAPYTIPTAGKYRINAKNGTTITCYLERRFVRQWSDSGTGIINIPLELKQADELYITLDSGSMQDVSIEIRTGFTGWYTIPMGYFTVDKCPMQASTGIFKVTAYNKLKSEYLDQKANEILAETFGDVDYELRAHDIIKALLGDYQIPEDREAISIPFDPTSAVQVTESITIGYTQLNSMYGVDSPLNAYRCGVPDTSSIFNVLLWVNTRDNIITDDYTDVDALKGTLLKLESNFWEWFKNLINDAHFTFGFDHFLDVMLQSGKLKNCFAVEVTPVGGSTKVYSTMAYDYAVSQGAAPSCRPLRDIVYRMIPAGCAVKLRIPSFVTLDITGGSSSMANPVYFDGRTRTNYPRVTTYEYYADSSLTTTAQGEVEPLRFSDGTIYDDDSAIQLYKYTNLAAAAYLTVGKISELPDFTLRNIASAVYESVCQFGKLDRITDMFAGVELNFSALYPADTLYPNDALYPGGTMERGFKSAYKKLWTDQQGEQTFRNLYITYKGLDENNSEKEYTLMRTVNANGTTDYYVSDNWLFKNLVWTAADVGTYADNMVSKMSGIKWFPFEMWCAGLPYIETGDQIEIIVGQNTYTSYILQRQLKGIHNLEDTYINGTLDIF